jgi:hypothetical protein
LLHDGKISGYEHHQTGTLSSRGSWWNDPLFYVALRGRNQGDHDAWDWIKR